MAVVRSKLAEHVDQTVTLAGLALQQALERQAPLPRGARRLRHRPVRGVQERRRRRGVRARPTARAGERRCEVTGKVQRAPQDGGRVRAAGERGCEIARRPGGEYPITPKEHGTEFLMDHRHLWLRSQAPARHPARAARHHPGDPRLLRRPRLHAGRRADLHAQRLRGDEHAVRDRLPRPARLPHPVGAALHGGRGGRVRQAPTASGRRSAPRSPRRAATSPSSGWSSPRWRSSDLDGVMDLAEDFLVLRRARACSRRGARSSTSLERDVAKLEACRSRSRACATPKRSRSSPRSAPSSRASPVEAAAARVGRRLRRRGRDAAVEALRPAGDGPPLPGDSEGVLHEARSRTTSGSRSAWT